MNLTPDFPDYLTLGRCPDFQLCSVSSGAMRECSRSRPRFPGATSRQDLTIPGPDGTFSSGGPSVGPTLRVPAGTAMSSNEADPIFLRSSVRRFRFEHNRLQQMRYFQNGGHKGRSGGPWAARQAKGGTFGSRERPSPDRLWPGYIRSCIRSCQSSERSRSISRCGPND